MVSKRKPTDSPAEKKHMSAVDADLQVTAYKNGYLIKGDIALNHARLKDFAKWNEKLDAWIISKRRAYEYDHQYGLRLFSK